MIKINKDKLILSGSPLAGGTGRFAAGNPQPFFRQPDLDLATGPNFSNPLPGDKDEVSRVDKEYSFGRETGFRVLPYTMQDRYNRKLTGMEFPSIVMENDFLRAEFIPQLGGRLWSLYDKNRKCEILYRNPVLRPANLAIRDAWFSGGIEWNIGRLGHTVHTCAPVFAGIVNYGGEESLRIWEFERQTRLYWSIDFFLPENSPALYCYTRIENPDNETKPLYWWTNIAVKLTKGVRVLSATDEVLYVVPAASGPKTIDNGRLPVLFGTPQSSGTLPLLSEFDASYPYLPDFSNEYFFQNDAVCNSGVMPWEAAVYEDGYAFGEMSTLPLLYRKMFAWGKGKGGRRWQDYLTYKGGEYLEIQAGLAPTQLHTADIAANGTIDWVQSYAAFRAGPEGAVSERRGSPPEKAFNKDYLQAVSYVLDCLKKEINPASLEDRLEKARLRIKTPAEILSLGSGWGALEAHLKNGASPPGLLFPEESIGEAEGQWAQLLGTGVLPMRAIEEGPGSFVVDDAFEALLKAAPARDFDWLTPYHLGVISFEKGSGEAAIAYWKESIKQAENPWALRNLAIAALKEGGTLAALGYYRRALQLPGSEDISFYDEYIPLLVSAGMDEEAQAELDAAVLRFGSLEVLSTPLLEAAARLALTKGDDDLLEQIFSIEQPHIREGKNTMIEIWKEREIKRLCKKGHTQKEAEEKLIEAMSSGSLIPPKEIDFRMYY